MKCVAKDRTKIYRTKKITYSPGGCVCFVVSSKVLFFFFFCAWFAFLPCVPPFLFCRAGFSRRGVCVPAKNSQHQVEVLVVLQVSCHIFWLEHRCVQKSFCHLDGRKHLLSSCLAGQGRFCVRFQPLQTVKKLISESVQGALIV